MLDARPSTHRWRGLARRAPVRSTNAALADPHPLAQRRVQPRLEQPVGPKTRRSLPSSGNERLEAAPRDPILKPNGVPHALSAVVAARCSVSNRSRSAPGAGVSDDPPQAPAPDEIQASSAPSITLSLHLADASVRRPSDLTLEPRPTRQRVAYAVALLLRAESDRLCQHRQRCGHGWARSVEHNV
jgi:hypothetical protein